MNTSLTAGARRRWGRRVLLLAIALAGVIAFASPRPSATPVAYAQSNPPGDRWMGAMAADIGRLRLQQVILPASHNSGTYAPHLGYQGPDPSYYATNQDIDVYQQLQHGIRVLDLRGRLGEFDGDAGLYVFHGKNNFRVKLSSILDDVRRWTVAPGHEKELLILKIDTPGTSALDDTIRARDARLRSELCSSLKNNFGNLLLTPGNPSMSDRIAQAMGEYQARLVQYQATRHINPAAVPPTEPYFPNAGNPDLARYTLNEIWSLPGQPRVIVHWDACVGAWPADTWNSYWANQCEAGEYYSARNALQVVANTLNPFAPPVPRDRPGIINALASALDVRGTHTSADGTDGGSGPIPMQPSRFVPAAGGRAPYGFYSVAVHATVTAECGYPLEWLLPQQTAALDWLKEAFDNNWYHARDYLNIISADFVQKSKLVEYAIAMNRPSGD